jgi:hypothetical protein
MSRRCQIHVWIAKSAQRSLLKNIPARITLRAGHPLIALAMLPERNVILKMLEELSSDPTIHHIRGSASGMILTFGTHYFFSSCPRKRAPRAASAGPTKKRWESSVRFVPLAAAGERL